MELLKRITNDFKSGKKTRENQLNWHVIKLSKDALTPQSKKIGIDGVRGGRYIVPITRGKLLIALSVEKVEGELYIPWERKMVTTRKGKPPVPRDFPMLPGYAFVNIDNPIPLFDMDGVSEVLKIENAEQRSMLPMQIHNLRMFENALYNEFIERHSPMTRKKLSRQFIRGSKVKLSNDALGGKLGTVDSTTGRKTVKTTMEMFGTMVVAEIPVELLEAG